MEDSEGRSTPEPFISALLSEIRERGSKSRSNQFVGEEVVYAGPFQLEHGEATLKPNWFAQKYTHDFVDSFRDFVFYNKAKSLDMLALPPDQLETHPSFASVHSVVSSIMGESLDVTVDRNTVIPTVVKAVLGAPKRVMLQYLAMEKGQSLIVTDDRALIPRLVKAISKTTRERVFHIASVKPELIKSFREHCVQLGLEASVFAFDLQNPPRCTYDEIHFDFVLHSLGSNSTKLGNIIDYCNSLLNPGGRILAMVPDPRGALTLQQLPTPSTKLVHIEALYPPTDENEDGVALTRLAQTDLFVDPVLSLHRLMRVARDFGYGVLSSSPREFFSAPGRAAAIPTKKTGDLLKRKDNSYLQIVVLSKQLPAFDLYTPLEERAAFKFNIIVKKEFLPPVLREMPPAKGRIISSEDLPWFKNGYYCLARKLEGVGARFYFKSASDPKHATLFFLSDDGRMGYTPLPCAIPSDILFAGELLSLEQFTGSYSVHFKIYDVYKIGVHANLGFSTRMSFLMSASEHFGLGFSFQRFFPSSQLHEVLKKAKKNHWEGIVFQQLHTEYGPFPMSLQLPSSKVCSPARYLKFDPTIDVKVGGVEFDLYRTVEGTPLPQNARDKVVTVSIKTGLVQRQPQGGYYRSDKSEPNQPDYVNFIKSALDYREVIEALSVEPSLIFDQAEVPGLTEFLGDNVVTPSFKISLALTYPAPIKFATGVNATKADAVYRFRRIAWEEIRTNPI